MHILITADGRSPIAINWIRMVLDAGHMVTLVTTYPCQKIPGVEHIIPLHVAFGSLAGGGSSPSSALRRLVRRFRPLFQAARNTFAPLGMERAGRQFSRLVEQVQPDIVHALRIPYEGILASHTPPGIPLVVNIWGNDFTLHANSSRMLGRLTTGTLRRADALMADTRRDLRLAVRWGFDSTKPALALPSAGGIDLEQVGAAVPLPFRQEVFAKIPKDIPWVVNPRGIRAYTRTDVFFQSIPLVLNRWQNVRFLCPGMENRKEAEDWVQRLGISDHVHLLPVLSQDDLWRLFSRSVMSLSITMHDGTPNTLLEAMACGSLPIAGDLETLREWITPGVNGLLVDPNQPQAVADAMLLGFANPQLFRTAAEINRNIILERAETRMVREKLQKFYQEILQGTGETGLQILS
ncbi:MAG TPA: glycosyltransferase family 4 protein [Anaerolineaceae bacterium]|nr:glycosyltransferase family 4 protein [Anaerolineaceae bacterium]